MTYDKDDLDDMLEFLSQGGDPEEAPEGHLSVQELTSYGDGEMPPEEARRIEEHLAACPECSALKAELAGFFASPPSRPEKVAEFEAAADWRKLRSRLDEDGWLDRGRGRHRRQGGAVAAVFLLALVGFYFYGFHVPSQKYQTLPPLNMERGSVSRPVEEVRLPTNLLLKPPLRRSLPEYKARFLDENGTPVLVVSDLRENSDYEIQIPMRRWRLSEGTYTIDLQGLRNGRFESVGRYAFRIPG